MTKFINGEFETSGQKWLDDPANAVADELLHELSEDLGTDGPAETFGNHSNGEVGRLVDEDAVAGEDRTHEAIAHDSHDALDLTAEEAAIHLISDDPDQDLDDPDLTDDVRDELRNF